MEILQVVGPMVCTHRHPGLETMPLRILQDTNGKKQVAVDTIGCKPGNWVFTISGSAARLALGKERKVILTDLTVGGIIDFWEENESRVSS